VRETVQSPSILTFYRIFEILGKLIRIITIDCNKTITDSEEKARWQSKDILNINVGNIVMMYDALSRMYWTNRNMAAGNMKM
jgi:hypothetical protein